MLIASKNDDAVQVSVIGEIMGENEWMASDAAYMRSILDASEGAPIDLWVSSPGGSLDAAMAMRAMLESYVAPITIHTAGIVASAATLLLCIPGARVIAERGSVFMLHQARMKSEGDARDMRKAAEVLDVCDDEIMQVYGIRLKCGDDELRDRMAAETWLRSSDALSLGLVDEIAGATSGGYIAEPQNPDPVPDAVSACLSPRFAELSASISTLSANGEQRVQAISGAADRAVCAIEASAKAAMGGLSDAAGKAAADVSAQVSELKAELDRVREVYAESAKKYAALDTALSTVYALVSGQTGFPMHDEQLKKEPFRLNV